MNCVAPDCIGKHNKHGAAEAGKHAMAQTLVGMVLKADPYAHTYRHTAAPISGLRISTLLSSDVKCL